MEPLFTAYVKIWNEVVGAVTWLDERGYGVFEYEPDFFKNGWDIAPIHLGLAAARPGQNYSFPEIDHHTFFGLPGLLASSLPDDFGNRIIDAWLRRNGRSPNSFNPVERLCYIGTRGMGALEYAPQLSSRKLNRAVSLEIEKLMELAREVLTERTRLDTRIDGSDRERAEAMLDILRVGVSAGGAVPKAVIGINDDGHVISGQSELPDGYDHWIVKFDGVTGEEGAVFGRSRDNGRVEYGYSLMAAAAGIDMSECRVLTEGSRAHFMTRRYDRQHNHKIHALSLACMGHYGWNPAGSVGYENAFQIMRQLRLPYPVQEQQYRRMVFNVLSANVDDHVKNISYIMDRDGIWQLSPAYDVTFTLNPEDMLGERHKMTINGKQKNITSADLLAVAENMEINKPQEIILEIAEAVAHWPGFAREAGVSGEVSKYIGLIHAEKRKLVAE